MSRFGDSAILITGAGSGLGQATAVRLASEGAHLALVDINETGLGDTVAAIEQSSPGTKTISITADVASEFDVMRYVTDTVSAYGRIDGFFNNAGIEGKQNLTQDYGAEEFDRVLSINLRGVFFGLKHVLQVMKEQGSGSIVNTASVGGIRGIGNQSGYAAAKHGVVGLTRNSAIEYGQFGISINAIAPGAIMTPMIQSSLEQIDPVNWEAVGQEYVSVNPMKRFGKAEEVAHLVAFLLSDEAEFINAAVIPIDGGQSYQY